MASRNNLSPGLADARRHAALAAAGGGAIRAPGCQFALAAHGRDARLVTIILRGAIEGSPPSPRWGILITLRCGPTSRCRVRRHPALPLDNFFGLHPAMPNFARLYEANQAIVVHAIASPYRERSHFDGQDVLETGLPGQAGSTAAG